MVSLYSILDCVQSYISGCENCEVGRTGSCALLNLFSKPGVIVVNGSSFEERARNVHKLAGRPRCGKQRSFWQYRSELLKLAGKARGEKAMPRTVTDVRDFLIRVMQTARGLDYLPDEMQALYKDAALYGLTIALGALDYYFLDTLHMDYLRLFRIYIPSYERSTALKEFSYDAKYINECISTAKKVNEGEEQVDADVAGTITGQNVVSTVTGILAGLDKELRSEIAMAVWTHARHVGWVTSNFEWRLGKQEKAMFVGRFSQYLFHDKRAHWEPFRKWDSNCNYPKDFSMVKDLVMVGDANETVTAISAYFDKIDRIHSLA